MIRTHIEVAGIEREELRVRTNTSRWIVFHDLRDRRGALTGLSPVLAGRAPIPQPGWTVAEPENRWGSPHMRC
jgi:hypothetical protein